MADGMDVTKAPIKVSNQEGRPMHLSAMETITRWPPAKMAIHCITVPNVLPWKKFPRKGTYVPLKSEMSYAAGIGMEHSRQKSGS